MAQLLCLKQNNLTQFKLPGQLIRIIVKLESKSFGWVILQRKTRTSNVFNWLKEKQFVLF